MAAYELNCRGQRCPKPIVQISKKMRELAAGDTLAVEADDPAFGPDLDAWLSSGMASLEGSLQVEGAERVLLRRLGDAESNR